MTPVPSPAEWVPDSKESWRHGQAKVDLAHTTELHGGPSIHRLRSEDLNPGVPPLTLKKLQRKQCVSIDLCNVGFIFTYHRSLSWKIRQVAFSAGKTEGQNNNNDNTTPRLGAVQNTRWGVGSGGTAKTDRPLLLVTLFRYNACIHQCFERRTKGTGNMVNGLANNAEIDDSSNCDATVVLLKKGNRVEPQSKRES